MEKERAGVAWTVTMRGIQGRDEVSQLRATDPAAALKVARAIRHPWYRCQALSSMAEIASTEERRDAILKEAVDAAFEQDEPNRIVSVAAWPLSVAIAFERSGIDTLVRRLLRTIATESHGLRRLYGLASILRPLLDRDELRAIAMRPFLQTAAACQGWRTERIVACMAVGLAQRDRAAALRLLDSRAANRFTQRARADIEGATSIGFPTPSSSSR